MALEKLLNNPEIDVVGLISTVNAPNGKISMHGVIKDLVYLQTQSIGLPIEFIPIPVHVSMDKYDNIMRVSLLHQKN